MVNKASESSVLVIGNNAIFHKKGRFSRKVSFDENEISDFRVISDIRENALQFAKRAGVESDDLADIQIALGEALSNAIKHGSPVLGVSRIGLGCQIHDGQFVAVVSDEGKAFDSRMIPEPSFDECPECGMGLYIMKQVMDAVEFFHNETGNQVRLVKKLAVSF